MTRQLLLWSLWAAALAALAVGNLVPSAAAMRLRPSRRNRMEEALFSWLRPLPGAWPARQRWLAGAAVGVAVVVWGWDFGPVVAVAGAGLAAVTAIVLGRLERGQERARRIRLCRQAPSGLEAMAACLDAGLPLRQAVAVVAKLSPPDLAGSLRVVVSGIGVGLSDAEAWRGLADNPVLGTVARDVARATDW
ncbi:MAG: hypothetical protein LBI84_08340, partial [Propionibacteriaceae bacterium]|nr:hypothetical protein [Propionibacteriaceae bacterium]